jgi:hypothetical protein
MVSTTAHSIQLRTTAFPKAQINERFSDGQASIAGYTRQTAQIDLFSACGLLPSARLGIADNSCGSDPGLDLHSASWSFQPHPFSLFHPSLPHQSRTNPALPYSAQQQKAFVPWHLIQINASILFLAYQCILGNTVSTAALCAHSVGILNSLLFSIQVQCQQPPVHKRTLIAFHFRWLLFFHFSAISRCDYPPILTVHPIVSSCFCFPFTCIDNYFVTSFLVGCDASIGPVIYLVKPIGSVSLIRTLEFRHAGHNFFRT